MRIVRPTLLLVVATLGFSSTSGTASACENCRKELEITAAEWQCLEPRLGELLDTRLSVVVVRMPSECAEEPDDDRYKSATPTSPIVSENSAPTYIIEKAHLICLEKKLSGERWKTPSVKIAFAKDCGADPVQSEE